MQKILVLMGITAITACSSAQNNNSTDEKIPSAVKDAFVKKYPNVKEVDWDKEDGTYEAEFEVNNKDFSIAFDPAGKIIEEEIEIENDELPQAVTDYITSNYKGKRIKEASKINTTAGTVEYEAEVDGEDLIFDSNGKFIRLY